MRNHITGPWQSGGDYPRNDGFLNLVREARREPDDLDQRKVGPLDVRRALGKVAGLFGVRRNENTGPDVLLAADVVVRDSDVLIGEVTTNHPIMAVYPDETETEVPLITRLQPPQTSGEA